jgi:D-glycero-alpha-D-manno-heptose-7-phosphate kinase
MIISRTPYRISFFGGGTDYPAWYLNQGGAVLSTTIDKYCYITCRKLPPFFTHKHRIVYSQIENVSCEDEIVHPSVKATLKWAGIQDGLEIHHDGDLPARSGLGSSSAFTVGLVHALYALQGRYASQAEIARDAIHIEQNLIQENVGSQDQVAAAFGGFNKIEFHKNGKFTVDPVIVPIERKNLLKQHLMLCFTGFSRIASEIAQSKINNLHNRSNELKFMRMSVNEAINLLQNHNESIESFGKLLDTNWQYKRSLSDRVSTPEIDLIYSKAKEAGAVGGKILGAGGGGFLLLFANPDNHGAIRSSLANLIHVPFDFEEGGSRIVLYQPNGI